MPSDILDAPEQAHTGPLFVPPALTPLHYCTFGDFLTEQQKLRYNQLFGLYINELIILFETQFAGAYVPLLKGDLFPPSTKEEIRKFLGDEERHWRMFVRLNRDSAPELYRDDRFRFVRFPRATAFITRLALRRPDLFPFMVFLIYIQESRVQYIAKSCIESAESMDARFVAVHRKHLEDEQEHLALDERVLTVLWDRLNAPMRRLNVWLLATAIREFFTLPKRSGMRILDRFVEEFPELAPRKEEIRAQLFAAVKSTRFYDTLYSEQSLPGLSTFLARFPDLRPIAEFIRRRPDPTVLDRPTTEDMPEYLRPSTRRWLLLGNLIPLLLVLTAVLAPMLILQGSANRILAGVALLYLVPPLIARAITTIAPLRFGALKVGEAAFVRWWIIFQLQMVFCRIRLLEEVLRLAPSVYSFWLRLWGAKIGRLTFWAPGVTILDRSLLDIGNDVSVGAGVTFAPHLFCRTAHGEHELLLAPIRIENRVILGGQSVIGPGVTVASGECTEACSRITPFAHYKNGRREKPGSKRPEASPVQ